MAIAAAAMCLCGNAGVTAEATVAVAGNFFGPAQVLSQRFSRATPHTLRLTSGSTGALFAQILHGAPFDVFLSADRKRPRLLMEKDLAVIGTQFTYAVGRLVLWGKDGAKLPSDGEEILRAGAFGRLAVANPSVAPYGAAAVSVLRNLGLMDALSSKLVYGQNIAQTFQFVETGNAPFGLVALSQMGDVRNPKYWQVPAILHDPIRQDAVLLNRAYDNTAAVSFLEYLRSPAAQALIQAFGYQVGTRR